MGDLGVLPENYREVRALRTVDGELTYVVYEKRSDEPFTRVYAVHGRRVAGPFKYVERLTVERGRMILVAVDLHDVEGCIAATPTTTAVLCPAAK